MESFVLKFDDYINEEINFKQENGVCVLEDRWFYYNVEDDIIYGCDEKPVGEDSFFAFNPKSCTTILGGDEKQYDVNNPVLLITYDTDKEEVKMFTEDALTYLQNLNPNIESIDEDSQKFRNHLADLFEDDYDTRHILIYGNKLVASSFDVIEEN